METIKILKNQISYCILSYVFYAREKKKIYEKKIDIEVKHSSHYINKNGVYLMYSLQNSKRAWVIINGIKYYINITNLEISEANNSSHIFTAKITYEYSMPDLS